MFKTRFNNIITKNDSAVIQVNSAKFGLVETIIDIHDVDKVKNITWHCEYSTYTKSYYIRGNYKNKKILLHRLIMNCPKDTVVDHINHDTLDNRKENLRICSNTRNKMNNKSNTSGVCGVVWNKERNKWQAQIKINGKLINLGRYSKFEDACTSRKNKELELGI